MQLKSRNLTKTGSLSMQSSQLLQLEEEGGGPAHASQQVYAHQASKTQAMRAGAPVGLGGARRQSPGKKAGIESNAGPSVSRSDAAQKSHHNVHSSALSS